MPDIDIKTLFFLFAAGNIFILLFFTAYIFMNKVRLPVIIIFVTAKLLFIITLTLFALRGFVPYFYSVSLANVFFLFGVSYELYSILFTLQDFNKKHFLFLNLIPFITSIIFLIFRNSTENTRIILSSFMQWAIYLTSGIYLLMAKYKTKMQRLAGIFVLIGAILLLTRAIHAILDKSIELFTNNIHSISYTLLFLGSLTSGIILILILKEKDEMQIRADNILLKELISKKDKFFSIIAHDLRSPIGSVVQLGQVILDDQEIDSDFRNRLINEILLSTKKTYNLLINLLQWANSELGALKIKPTEICLKEIVESNLNLAKGNIITKKIDIDAFIDKNTTVYADYNMLDTVIRNLLSNAIKFTPENGKINIRSDLASNNYRNLYIKDTGIGIEKETIPKLFDLDSEYTTKGTNKESGTGLGLKLCKEFIVKNKGTITVESELNKGSTFCISLPIYQF